MSVKNDGAEAASRTHNHTLRGGQPDAPQKPKGGRSALAEAARIAAFVEYYLVSGHNAAAAAESISGRKLSQARNAGWKMLRKPAVQSLIAERAQKVAEQTEMSTSRWAAELSAVAFANVGDLYDAEGELLPVAQMPRHVQAALTPIRITSDGEVEYRFLDKVAALVTMARHLGLFERDNAQQSDITVRVELVG
jgi:phage terminase small subunit